MAFPARPLLLLALLARAALAQFESLCFPSDQSRYQFVDKSGTTWRWDLSTLCRPTGTWSYSGFGTEGQAFYFNVGGNSSIACSDYINTVRGPRRRGGAPPRGWATATLCVCASMRARSRAPWRKYSIAHAQARSAALASCTYRVLEHALEVALALRALECAQYLCARALVVCIARAICARARACAGACSHAASSAIAPRSLRTRTHLAPSFFSSPSQPARCLAPNVRIVGRCCANATARPRREPPRRLPAR